MKSIQSRFLLLILTAIILPVGVIGIIALRESSRKSDIDAVSIMNLTCREEADKIDAVLENIEKSVELVADYALRQMDSTERFFEDEDYRKDYTENAERLFIEVAENTDGAVTFYYRYNATEIDTVQGFLYTRENLASPFVQLPLTDISLYDPDDTEHVGWYYIPVRNGVSTWMAPYQNLNLDIYMISFVIPLFKDDRLLGIVGMDVNFQVIIDELMQIHPFETGYAFLTGRDGAILYHPSLAYGTLLDGSDPTLPALAAILTEQGSSSTGQLYSYDYDGTKKKLAYTTLINGSVLSLVADTRDINAGRDALLLRITIASLCIAGFFMLASFFITKKTLAPLHDLALVADRVAGGDLNVEIPKATSTEIESLISAYQKTVDRMREQLRVVDNLAHRDELTGLYNRSSFREKRQELDQQFKEKTPVFAIVMMDVNNLKGINDTYGHEAGDLYLKHAADTIRSLFGEKVYRIGGDEFVAFIEEEEVLRTGTKLETLVEHKGSQLERVVRDEYSKANPWERFDAAYGIAVCTLKDTNMTDVYERADHAMYEKKAEMKGRMPNGET